MIDVVDTLAMTHATAREAYELRMQGSDSFGDIATQTMTFVGVLREETYHINGNGAPFHTFYLQTGAIAVGSSCEIDHIARPLLGIGFDDGDTVADNCSLIVGSYERDA